MPFFDSQDYADPQTQAAMGTLAAMAQSFGQSAMPTATPTPLGAVLGKAGGAAISGELAGAKAAQDYRGANLDNASKAIGNDQSLIFENLLRQRLGLPALSADDVKNAGTRSPIFGWSSASPSPTASTPQPAQAPDQFSKAATATVPATAAGADPAASTGATPPATGPGAAYGDMLINQKLGLGTDYTKAKAYADSLPPRSAERREAETYAAKIAGYTVTVNQRAGEATSLLDPENLTYGEVSRNPNLPPGVEHDPISGQNTVAPSTLNAMGDIADVENQSKANAKNREAGFEHYLDFGPAGGTTPSGAMAGLGQPGAAATSYAARVNQIENPANNPGAAQGSTAAGPDQFVDGTWLQSAKKYLPAQMTAGKTDQQIMAMRQDPTASGIVTNGYAYDNGNALVKAGIKHVGPSELYLAHHFGPGGAAAILKAQPNQPIGEVVSPQAMAANPGLQGATVADVVSSSQHHMAGVQPLTGPQAPAGTLPTSGGILPGVKTAIPDPAQATKIDPAGEYLKTRMKQWADTEDNWQDSLQSGQIAEQRAMAIGDALKDVQSGAYTEHLADFAAKLKAISPALLKALPADWQKDPGAVQKVLKNNFQSTLQQIRAFSARPAAIEVQLAAKNFANPDLQPEANQQIVAETVGTLRWQRALINDWAAAKGKPNAQGQYWQDPQDFSRAWMKSNPIQPYIDQTVKEMGPLKGMAQPGGGNAQPHASVQQAITPASIHATALKHGQTDEQVKSWLRGQGYKVD